MKKNFLVILSDKEKEFIDDIVSQFGERTYVVNDLVQGLKQGKIKNGYYCQRMLTALCIKGVFTLVTHKKDFENLSVLITNPNFLNLRAKIKFNNNSVLHICRDPGLLHGAVNFLKEIERFGSDKVKNYLDKKQDKIDREVELLNLKNELFETWKEINKKE